MPLADVKGTPVEIDSLVEGFYGVWENARKKVAKARVTWISPWGWIVGYDAEKARQHVFYEKRFLVREGPRPFNKRGDIPERLLRR